MKEKTYQEVRITLTLQVDIGKSMKSLKSNLFQQLEDLVSIDKVEEEAEIYKSNY